MTLNLTRPIRGMFLLAESLREKRWPSVTTDVERGLFSVLINPLMSVVDLPSIDSIDEAITFKDPVSFCIAVNQLGSELEEALSEISSEGGISEPQVYAIKAFTKVALMGDFSELDIITTTFSDLFPKLPLSGSTWKLPNAILDEMHVSSETNTPEVFSDWFYRCAYMYVKGTLLPPDSELNQLVPPVASELGIDVLPVISSINDESIQSFREAFSNLALELSDKDSLIDSVAFTPYESHIMTSMSGIPFIPKSGG